MPRETYDYSKNPDLDNFKRLVHGDGSERKHPGLAYRDEQARKILSEIPRIPIPPYADPRLAIQPADQGLVLTPFDEFIGMRVEIPPQIFVEGWKVLHDYNLRVANHPARTSAMRCLETRGFQSPVALEGVIDADAKEGTLLQLADLGHANALTQWVKNREAWEDISGRIRRLKSVGLDQVAASDNLRCDLEVVREFTDGVMSQRQAHRTELLATGPFSLINGKAFSLVGIGAMPDITASVLMGETAAKMFVPFCIPRETGKYSDPEGQAELAKAILERLTVDDPLLSDRPKEEKEYIVDHWKSCLIGTLEVDKEKALRRFEMLRKAGVTAFRPYGHTEGGDKVETIDALRKEDPRITLIASQITTIPEALACWNKGANKLIIGVGSGGRCTTAQLSELIPTNAVLAWTLRGLVDIPVWGEGGAIDDPIVSLLAGMSGVNGSGSIGGGTFEATGGMYFFTRDGETYEKPYRGEASDGFKYLSGRTYADGLPFFSEGEQTFKKLRLFEESMTQKMLYHWQRLVLAAVVLGIDNGPFSYFNIQNFEPSPFWKKTRTTAGSQAPH